jgi:hypothetical protein
MTTEAGETIVHVIKAIAKERQEYLVGLRAALKSEDDQKLKFYARKLCGLLE